MPVNTQETGFKLDRIIGIGDVVLGVGPDALPYSVHRIDRGTLTELVLQWSAVPIGDTGTQWLLYVRIPARVETFSAFNVIQYYWPLDGLFPVGASLTIEGEIAKVTALAAPASMLVEGVRDLHDTPTITDDGDALFARARLGSSLREQTETGLDNYVHAAVVATLDNALSIADITADSPVVATLTGAGQGLNLQVANERSAWAQEQDRTVVPLTVPDGVLAGEVVYEESVSWIVRKRVSVASVIVSGGNRYGLSEVKPLGNGRYWFVTGSRRYIGVSL